MFRAVLASFAALTFVSIIGADGPEMPVPRDFEPSVTIEGIDKYPDYVFRVESGRSSFRQLHDVQNGTSVIAKGGISYRTLLAIPRKEFETRTIAHGSTEWLTRKAEGVLRAEINPPGVKRTYLVQIQEGKLIVEAIETPVAETPPSSPRPQTTSKFQ